MGYVVSRMLESNERNCKEFYLDNGEADLPLIYNKVDIARGSIAIDIGTGDEWILDSEWKWARKYIEDKDVPTPGPNPPDPPDPPDPPEPPEAEYPTFIDPTAAYEYTEESSATIFVNIGEVSKIEIKASFDRGSITPAYGTSGFRAGAPTAYSYIVGTQSRTISSAELENTTTFSYEALEEANTSLVCTVAYGEGPQPLDSNGNNYDAPLPAGTIVLNSLSVQSTYPVLYGLSSDESLAILPFSDEDTFTERFVPFEAEPTADINQTFAIPATHTLVGIKMQNLAGQWDWVTGTAATSLLTFEESSSTQTLTIGGKAVDVEYKLFANAYSKNGARTILLVLEENL